MEGAQIQIGHKEESFNNEGGGILEHVAQRSVQIQAGWGFKHPGLV